MRATIDARLAGFNRNPERPVNLSTSQLIRFPCDVVGSACFSQSASFCLTYSELVCGGVRASRIHVVLKPIDHGSIPSRMEISHTRVRFHRDTIAAFVRVGGRVQGLVNIANRMNEERQITASAPFVAIPLLEAVHVLIDFRRNADPARASRRSISPPVLQTDVNVVPWGG